MNKEMLGVYLVIGIFIVILGSIIGYATYQEITPTAITGTITYKSSIYSGGIGIGAFSDISFVVTSSTGSTTVTCNLFNMSNQDETTLLQSHVGQRISIYTNGNYDCWFQ